MFRTLDLKAVVVATSDLEAAVTTFRRNFGLPVTRETRPAGDEPRVALGIGKAEIEMRAVADPAAALAAFLAERGPGLYSLELVVDSLSSAESDLAARGLEVTRREIDGRPVLLLSPRQTHGARIVLVEAPA